MRIEIKNCRFDGGNGEAGLAVVAAYIQTERLSLAQRTEEPKRVRSLISKRHNYKFNFKNR